LRIERLGDISDLRWGDTSTTKASYAESGYPAYSASGPDGFLPYADYNHVGVVLSAIGADCGKTWLAKGSWSCIKNTIRFWATDPDVDTEYLYWLTRNPSFWPKRGSAQPFISQGDARSVLVALPELSEQRAIAHVLGALDDKIELNRKMSATLEAVARALFKSWFVDFDPVRAKAEGRDPGLSAEIAAPFPDSFDRAGSTNIPNRWTVATVGDVFVATMGQSPPGFTYNQEEDGLPFYQGRADFGFRFPKRRVYCKAPTRYANAGDTLLSVRAPVGDINLAIENCSIGRGVAALRHNSGSSSYTYYATWFLKEALEAYNGEGTVFGSISKADLSKLPILEPPVGLVSAFDRICGPLDERVALCQRETGVLGALRDALLPKLISGELRVGDAERVLAASA